MTSKARIIEQILKTGYVENHWAIDNRITTRLGAVIFVLKKEGWEFIGEELEHKNYRYTVIKKPEKYYKKGSLSLSSARKPKKIKKHKPAYYGAYQLKDKEAWKSFSRYIRARDGKCVTCPSGKPENAGHYFPGSVCGKALFFSEINVNAQCSFSCNRMRHGNIPAYTLYLEAKYGQGIIQKLEAIRREEKEKGIICRFSKEELKEIAEKYQKKLEELKCRFCDEILVDYQEHTCSLP